MSAQEMLNRADLVFVGIVQKHHFESWPYFQIDIPRGEESKYWRVLRREIRVETLIRGTEPRNIVNVYEVYWTGGTSGDWNFTEDGERALFLVRRENGRYHVVRDWWRSIFPVTSGRHDRLPLDDSHPLWERIALMNWWVPRNDSTARINWPYFHYNDPGWTLSQWRVVKLERGLVRHPSPAVRIPACRELLLLGGWCQDECWELLSDAERTHLSDGGYLCCSASEIASTRKKTEERGAEWWWQHYSDRESRRLLTASSNRQMRKDFCAMWERKYPEDHDNGCPPDQPPPAAIVTEGGDIPLLGAWPSR